MPSNRFAAFKIGLGLSAIIAASQPAFAQRADENAVRSADDAFGSSVGNERVGLYTPFNTRGFSPVDAGNVRLETMSIDLQGFLSERLVGGSRMRVGIAAQGYPFPAPTGIADYSLRRVGSQPMLSMLVGFGPWEGARLEVDAQLPVTDTFGLAGGVNFVSEGLHVGNARQITSGALISQWEPSEQVSLTSFWSTHKFSGQEAWPLVFTDGTHLPPKTTTRRQYPGQSWAESSWRNSQYGTVAKVELGDWTVRGGLFRSLNEIDWSYTDLSFKVAPDGTAERFVVAERDRRLASVSGEVRVSRVWEDGLRRHTIHLMGRGRDQNRRYGGSDTQFIGRGPFDKPMPIERPDFQFGEKTRDRTQQWTGGLGYELRWGRVGELSVGIQRTDYRKVVNPPASPPIIAPDKAWLYNAAGSINATDRLALYASYTTGIEEAPVAPDFAANRGEAAPAIRTRQMDAGVRFVLNPDLRLVAGLFRIEKPYYQLDTNRNFRRLGERAQQGAEFSLAGRLARGLNAVVGAILFDSKVVADPDAPPQGKRPLGFHRLSAVGTLDYQLPFQPGLSVDLSVEATSRRASNQANSLWIPARQTVSMGARYRFQLAGKPASFRAHVGNIFNGFGWVNEGTGFILNAPRRVTATLAVDV